MTTELRFAVPVMSMSRRPESILANDKLCRIACSYWPALPNVFDPRLSIAAEDPVDARMWILEMIDRRWFTDEMEQHLTERRALWEEYTRWHLTDEGPSRTGDPTGAVGD